MAQAFKLPDLGEGIHEGEVVAVLVKEGEHVNEGQPILEIETDKASVEIPSPYTGVVQQISVKPDDTVRVGTVMMVFDESRESSGTVAAPLMGGSSADGATPPRSKGTGPVPASPATRRLARELGVDLREVPGSGRGGLVTAEDVRRFSEAAAKAIAERATPAVELPAATETLPEQQGIPSAPPLPDFSKWGEIERTPMRSVRRAAARHLALAWAQIPHVNHQDVADITDLEAFRRKQAPEVEAQGGKLTLTVLVMKAVAAALKAFPRFNSSVDMGAEEIILKRYYHLGLAVDTDRGLVVPVIRDANQKSITELAIELTRLADRTRAGDATLEEMQGGTFTITNIGALGGTGFAPIINHPQVAILGMGRAKVQPVVRGDENDYQIVPRLMMPLVLAFDHRVLDGADAARFVRTIIECLENPDKLWLRI